MKKIDKEKEFHAVEYMREIRSKLSELALRDRQKYKDYLNKAMEEYRNRRKEANN